MIPKYRKVLAVTDLSAIGNAAIPHAYAILAGQGGTIILWHVINVSGMPDPLYTRYTPGKAFPGQQQADFRQALFSSLEALVPEEARAEGMVTTEVRVVEVPGAVDEAICQEAATLEVDLIVMASHGYSGMKHLVLGSVAEGVLRLADRPVLIVRSRG